MYVRCDVKYPLFLSNGNENNFSDKFMKNPHITDIMKIRTVGAELFPLRQTDGSTDGQILRS